MKISRRPAPCVVHKIIVYKFTHVQGTGYKLQAPCSIRTVRHAHPYTLLRLLRDLRSAQHSGRVACASMRASAPTYDSLTACQLPTIILVHEASANSDGLSGWDMRLMTSGLMPSVLAIWRPAG